jgi:hypothetical protein
MSTRTQVVVTRASEETMIKVGYLVEEALYREGLKAHVSVQRIVRKKGTDYIAALFELDTDEWYEFSHPLQELRTNRSNEGKRR